ncbi:type II toxin-antitoxin system RelE/ParE family toxin [Rhizobium binae]|uniref:type II toxin-antitoxin system RelE/ParE family toxin n=1 Tax=Rhizobium binae TaxID=1138190 RepID=UPI001FEF470C|nr:type II toxin-antitoxin system RelE/ParE family toxin [Rhizobium binae]
MTFKVAFRPRAEKDLFDIYEFIAADNPPAAIEFIRRLRHSAISWRTCPKGDRRATILRRASAF